MDLLNAFRSSSVFNVFFQFSFPKSSTKSEAFVAIALPTTFVKKTTSLLPSVAVEPLVSLLSPLVGFYFLTRPALSSRVMNAVGVLAAE